MTDAKFGQKRVLAASIEPGDVVFWSTEVGGELMMTVQSVSRAPRDDGVACMRFTGSTYALNPSSVGEQITGDELGDDTWLIPDSGRLYKRVPWGEADHD